MFSRLRDILPLVLVAVLGIEIGGCHDHVDAIQPLLKAPVTPIEWSWSDDDASIMAYVAQLKDPYRVVLESNPRDCGALKISLYSGEDHSYSWPGHRFSCFLVKDGVLYYTHIWPIYHPAGELISVDVKSGKVRWKAQLEGLSVLIWDGRYRNRMNLVIKDQEVIIFGNESNGRYVEARDLATGHLRSHQILSNP